MIGSQCRKTLRATIAAGVLCATHAEVLAHEPVEETVTDQSGDRPVSLSAEFKLVSDYRDRGFSYSTGSPAAQALVIATHRSGFYLGAFASTTGNDPYLGAVELDVLAGWSGQIAPNLTADVTLLYYYYPDADHALLPHSNSWETALHLYGDFGVVRPSVGIWYAWHQAALGGLDNVYVFADLAIPIGSTPFSAKLHAGYTDGAYTLDPDHKVMDWGAGLSFHAGSGLSVSLDYTGMNGPSMRDLTDDSLILSLKLEL